MYTALISRRLTCALALGLAAHAWQSAQAQGKPHAGLFINPAITMKGACTDPDSCREEGILYLQAIGVLDKDRRATPNRGTSKAWKAWHGFSSSPQQPGAGELRAVYWNDGDLGLGRDMHCRFNLATEVGDATYTAAWTHACYVTNYAVYSGGRAFVGEPNPEQSIAQAANEQQPIATVAMEQSGYVIFREGFTDYHLGDVQFIAFNEQEGGRAWVDPPLDSEGPKALPGTCIACHGGTYFGSGSPGGSRVERGNFLPFDVASFKFTSSPELTAFSEVSQREALRELNAFVRDTQPTPPTISDLIDGWYGWCGGVDAAACYADPWSHPYLPSGVCSESTQSCGWDSARLGSNKPSHLAQSVYKNVASRYCRTCHIAIPNKQNTEHFLDWKSKAHGVVKNSLMPFAELPYRRFQNDPLAQAQLESFFSGSASSCVNHCKSCFANCGALFQECIAENVGMGKPKCFTENDRCRAACPPQQPCIDACPY